MKPPKTKIRNLVAVAAFLRAAPKFKHKTAPKKGSKNWRDYERD